MSAVIDRARADIAAGRLWKARDRLTGALVNRADDELLGLLGEVHFGMHNLPRAGSIWFATQRSDAEAQAADAAWRERHGDDAVQLFLSLPPSVRRSKVPRVLTLLGEARAAAGPRQIIGRTPFSGSVESHSDRSLRGIALRAVALLVAAAVLACLVVGAWTLLDWGIS